jgi:hypothetical protein
MVIAQPFFLSSIRVFDIPAWITLSRFRLTANDSLQGFAGAVRDDFGADGAAALENPEHGRFAISTTAGSAFDLLGAEVGLSMSISS